MNQNSGGTHSRYEINRMVSGILTRHRIEIEVLSLSSSSSLVYLAGIFRKAGNDELTPADVDLIFREIEALPPVRGIIADLENWVIANVEGRWQAVPKGRSSRPAAAAPATGGDDHRIENKERIADVLEQIRLGNKDKG